MTTLTIPPHDHTPEDTPPPSAPQLLTTALANALGLFLWLSPIAIAGLVFCLLSANAARTGDQAHARSRLATASALARISVYGGLALLVIGAIGIVFVLPAKR